MVENIGRCTVCLSKKVKLAPSVSFERDKQLEETAQARQSAIIKEVIDIIMNEFAHDATAVIDHKFYLSQFGTNDYLDHSCIVKYLEQLDSRISNKTEDQKAFEQAYGIRNSTSVK